MYVIYIVCTYHSFFLYIIPILQSIMIIFLFLFVLFFASPDFHSNLVDFSQHLFLVITSLPSFKFFFVKSTKPLDSVLFNIRAIISIWLLSYSERVYT